MLSVYSLVNNYYRINYYFYKSKHCCCAYIQSMVEVILTVLCIDRIFI